MIMILSLFNTSVLGYADCDTHTCNKDCEYCVQRSSWWDNCKWCELDEQCHATGSETPYNQCNTDQVITDVGIVLNQSCIVNTILLRRICYLLKLSAIPYILNSLEMNDFEIVEWIGRHCEDLSSLAYRECVATVMISYKRNVIVFAYQGTTEFKLYLDEMQSVVFSSKVSGCNGNGEVQEYFKEVHDRIFPCVITTLKEQISSYPNYNILITDHSLGGVIASIASASLIYNHIIKDEKISLYTFGMPKVGNSQYALEHNRLVTKSWRFVHRDDPIPHYPTSTGLSNGPLHHRTEVYYPSRYMLPTDRINYVIFPGSNNDDCGSTFQVIWDFKDNKMYFDIPVGTYSDNIIGRKRRLVKSAINVGSFR